MPEELAQFVPDPRDATVLAAGGSLGAPGRPHAPGSQRERQVSPPARVLASSGPADRDAKADLSWTEPLFWC